MDRTTEPQTDAQASIDRRQAEAIAQALLAEGQARQREHALQRWNTRETRRSQARAGWLSLAATGLAWSLAKALDWHWGSLQLMAVWVPVYLLARRMLASRARAQAVIES